MAHLDAAVARIMSAVTATGLAPANGIDGMPGPLRIRSIITDDGRLTMYRAADASLGEFEQRLRGHMIAELLAVSDEGQLIEACA